MAKLSVAKGATSVLIRIFIQDSTSTTGAGKTGLTNTSFTGTKVYVSRDDDGNAGGTSVSLTAATRGTWSSGGIVEKDATNMPGVYEFGLTNASIATGSRSCQYLFIGTGIVPCPVEIELTGTDNQDAVHGGMSALPNTACTTNASLLTSGTGAAQIQVDGAGNAYANVNKWLAGTIPAVNVTGVPLVDLKYTLGTISPAAAGYVAIDWAHINAPSTGVNLSGTTVQTAATIGSAGITQSSFSTDSGLIPIRVSATQAGNTSSTIVLDSGASATDHFYDGLRVRITVGTAVNQVRTLRNYVGSTKTAGVVPNWTTTPATGDTFLLYPQSSVWDELVADHLTAGTTGAALNATPTTTGIATAVWQDTTAGDFTVASSIGKSLYTSGNAPGAASGLAIVGSNMGTVTGVTGLTTTTIATAVWQDATAGDFTVASSIGKSLYTSGNAPGAASGLALVGSNVGTATGVTGLTTATIATAVWTDTTAGDFTTNTSPGKIIFTQLGGAFTTTSSSVFTTASLVNAPGGDPWATVIPGSYAAGTAGHRLGNVPDAAFPTNFTSLAITGTGQISEVVLCDTLTTYTSNTPQSGDSYARIGAPVGATISADIQVINAFLTPATSLTITFPMRSSTDGSLQPGKTVTATRITDGAAPTGCTNAVTENAGGDGKYSILLSATDLTFTSSVVFVFTATGCQETIMPFFTT